MKKNKKKITLTPHYENGIKYTTVLASANNGECWISERQLNAAEKPQYMIIATWSTKTV